MKLRHSQRGAALLVAMLVLTLVGTLAAGMVWQQWRAIEVESAERQRAQAAWILTGALDLGRVVLRLDGRTPGVDHLQEPWATPLPETSLSSLLAQDRNNNVEGAPEAYLSGNIRDAQAQYNLRNLVDPATRRIVEAELATLARLCEAASVAPEAAQTIATGLAGAIAGQASGSGDGAPPPALAPQNAAQLRWLGLDAETVSRLQDYVTLLPEPTPLNLNTAEPAVIAAVINVDVGSANRLKNRRPIRSLDDVRADIPQEGALDPKRVGVNSKYFEVSGRLRMDGRVIEERQLVERKNRDIVPLARSRQSVLPAAP